MVPVPHPSRSAYPAALILTGSIIPVPFVALVLTAIIYLLPLTTLFHTLSLATSWLPEFAVDIFSGLVLSLALWLLLSILFRGVVTRERLNPGSSSEIDSHKLSLEAAVKNAEATLNAYDEQQSTDLDTVHALIHLNPPAYKESVEKVQKCLQALEEGYQQSRFRWLDGSGYLTAWNSIHSAEEALIDIAPVEEVIKEAFRIDAALEGSPLPTRDDDLNMLRIAVRQLRPSAAIYYMKPPAVTDPIGMDALLKDIKKKDIKEVVDARMAIRTVRSRLDKFREESWDGLLRVRNRLIETALITGALSYILLSATLLIGENIAPKEMIKQAIEAALIFYLVGAFIGMFGRVITEFQATTDIDDYGLTVARLVVTPLIAGLAALAGVFLLAILSVNLLKSPTATNVDIPTLDKIFSLRSNPQGLLSAAIFGLTPNLVISALKQQADAITTRLQNTSPSSQGTK